MQDILIVPMMLTLNFMAKGKLETIELARTVFGGLAILIFMYVAIRKKLIKIPFRHDLIRDHDLQVFLGFVLCFGMAQEVIGLGYRLLWGRFWQVYWSDRISPPNG